MKRKFRTSNFCFEILYIIKFYNLPSSDHKVFLQLSAVRKMSVIDHLDTNFLEFYLGDEKNK